MDFTERDALTRLLLQTRQGDQRAFDELYHRTAAKLFGICVRLLRDRNDAEEVLQEIYVTVWRRAADFDPSRASAMTWMIALSRNKAIDRLRQLRREPVELQQWDEMEDEVPTPAAET